MQHSHFKRENIVIYRRKKKINIKRLLLLLTFFCIIAVMPLAYGPLFTVKNIQVTGNKNIASGEIIKAVDVFYNKNLLMIKPKVVSATLMEKVPVKEVKVRYKLPHTLLISVKERQVAAALPYLNNFILIDQKGIIIKIVSKLDYLSVPVITGFDVTGAKVASKVKVSKNASSFESLLELLPDITSFSSELSEINTSVDEMNDPVFNLYTLDGYQIVLGSSWDEKKIALMKDILENLREKKLGKGKLDLSSSTPIFKPFEKR